MKEFTAGQIIVVDVDDEIGDETDSKIVFKAVEGFEPPSVENLLQLNSRHAQAYSFVGGTMQVCKLNEITGIFAPYRIDAGFRLHNSIAS